MLKKSERRMALVKYVAQNPFATDDQLAERFGVSVATIRLDRMSLHIPEARERIRQVASEHHDAVRSLEQQEVIGDITELHLNRFAASFFEVSPPHVFSRNGIVRGHYLFGQVNSLATAVIDADVVVTAKSELRFYRPVRLGERLHARVDVLASRAGMSKCRAIIQSGEEKVLEGVIWVMSEPSGLKQNMSEGAIL
jgi:acyl-coenzyme A thioesterase PaaI-like protein